MERNEQGDSVMAAAMLNKKPASASLLRTCATVYQSNGVHAKVVKFSCVEIDSDQEKS
jgi:hypothetical protein